MLSNVACLAVFLGLSAGILSAQTSSDKNSNKEDKQKPRVVASSATVPSNISLIEGTVVLVYDGDLISIETKDKKVYSIWLQGIDAPEAKQNFGKRSKKALADMILDKEVKVVVHRKDSLDRYIGSVYVDGQDVSLKQLESGMAWYLKANGYQQPAEERKRYAQAELKARAEKTGLWNDDTPTAPWDFREGKKTASNSPLPDTVEAATLKESGSTRTDASGRTYITGPRGGCYYVSASGKKNYVDKSYCNQ